MPSDGRRGERKFQREAATGDGGEESGGNFFLMFPVEAGAQRAGRLGGAGADAGGLRGQNGIGEEAESPGCKSQLKLKEVGLGRQVHRIYRSEFG